MAKDVMKVLLIVPTFKYSSNQFGMLSVSDFPTGLAYIASSLKQNGHEVVGLNLNNDFAYKTPYEMVRSRITKSLREDFDLIALGGICTDYQFIRDSMEIIRIQSSVPILLGGGIVNNDYEFIVKHLKPDYAIIGEAEETIVKLCNALQSKSDTDNISNLITYRNGVYKCNKIDYTYPDIDSRPFPDYEIFGIKQMLDNYSFTTRILYRYSRTNPRPFVISTARSCPFNCSFCVHSHGSKYRARSIGNIMAEIKENYEKYKFNILIIQDELFAVNKQRMVEFCNALIEYKKNFNMDFDWMFQTHANARLDRETLELAKKSGCYFFSYGLESASPAVLKSMNKKTHIPQIIETIKMANEIGIGFGGNFIFGDPEETEETIIETLDFYYRYCNSSFVFMSIVEPYPGSKVFDYCWEKNLISDKKKYYETLGMGYFNMTKMSNQVFLKWVNTLSTIEQGWFHLKQTEGTYKQFEDLGKYGYYLIESKCPYCEKDIKHTQVFQDNDKSTRLYIGTGCPECNKRIRINLRSYDRDGHIQ